MIWIYWRKMWRVRISRYHALFLTPWFAIEVRSGALWEEPSWLWWRGLRVWWGHTPKWNYKEGDLMFRKFDFTLGLYCAPE